MVVAPVLTSYRLPLYNGLCDYFDEVVVVADAKVGQGFKTDTAGRFRFVQLDTGWFGRNRYHQKGLIRAFLKERPDFVFGTLDSRASTFWLLLLIAKIVGIPSFWHTQGLYNKEHLKSYSIYKHAFKVVAWLSNGLICYTKTVREGLLRAGISPTKLTTMDNTIRNTHALSPEEKPSAGNSGLYIGRLREGCNLSLLFEAMAILKSNGKAVSLHLIGDGDLRCSLEQSAKSLGLDVTFYGALYDDNEITNISKCCSFGVYPGDAGLSIIHYMSLSLVPIAHGSPELHMGPEPGMLRNRENSLLFERGNAVRLASAIEEVCEDPRLANRIRRRAFDEYKELAAVSMESKLATALLKL